MEWEINRYYSTATFKKLIQEWIYFKYNFINRNVIDEHVQSNCSKVHLPVVKQAYRRGIDVHLYKYFLKYSLNISWIWLGTWSWQLDLYWFHWDTCRLGSSYNPIGKSTNTRDLAILVEKLWDHLDHSITETTLQLKFSAHPKWRVQAHTCAGTIF